LLSVSAELRKLRRFLQALQLALCKSGAAVAAVAAEPLAVVLTEVEVAVELVAIAARSFLLPAALR
jgi:hypothetical protein